MGRWSPEEQKKHRQDLIGALRSQRYEPPVVDGKFNSDGYTAASVAWRVAGVGRDEHFDNFTTSLVHNLAEWYGFKRSDGRYKDATGHTKHLFGNAGLSFEEVANIIESEPEGLVETEFSFPTRKWERNHDGSIERSITRKFPDKSDMDTIDTKLQITEFSDGWAELVVTKTITIKSGGMQGALKQSEYEAAGRWGDVSRTRHMVGSEEIAIVG